MAARQEIPPPAHPRSRLTGRDVAEHRVLIAGPRRWPGRPTLVHCTRANEPAALATLDDEYGTFTVAPLEIFIDLTTI